MADACVLMADITGSTPLYDRLPQQEALDLVSRMLDRMRELVEANSGRCIKSQGDDTLSVFRHAEEGFAAALAMLNEPWAEDLSVHAGLFFGEVLRHQNDIYGNAVNTAARLAGLAKPGELLVGDDSYDRLNDDQKAGCVSLGGIKLKGKQEATRVYSFTNNLLENQNQTIVFGSTTARPRRRTETVTLQVGDAAWTLEEGQSITIGRADDNDVTLPHAWVSRYHGKVELREAQMEFTDHSSTGSAVLTADGQEIEVRRRTTLLNGEGKLLIGTPDVEQDNSILSYATNDLIPDES